MYDSNVKRTRHMSVKNFKVQVVTPGAGSRTVDIEAINRPQAKTFAEARYPGCRIAGIRQA